MSEIGALVFLFLMGLAMALLAATEKRKPLMFFDAAIAVCIFVIGFHIARTA